MRFTNHRSPFTVRLPFTINRLAWETENGSLKTYGKPKTENRKWRVVLAASLGLASFAFGHSAGAAALTGITVSPAFQMVTIQAGAAAQPVSFKITNNEPRAQNLSLSVRDFNALNESGGLFFVGTNPTALQKKYGLAKWVSLPTSQLTIQPKQTATLNAQILNLPDLAAGGHYGALMISLAGGSAGGQIGFQPIASSLLFVTKPQGATYQLGLSSVSYHNSLFNLPRSVTLRFQNTGNTHVVPRGSVYIRDPRGKLISKGIINEDSNIVLPQTYRRFSVALNSVSKSSSVGNYKLHVDFRFDGISQYRGYQRSMFHIPMQKLIALIVIVLALIAGLLVAWHKSRKAKPKKIKVVHVQD